MQIHANDLRKTYGHVTALDGLDLEIPSGSTFGVLGTNGAGKTTFFKLLVGLDRPDGGTLTIGDRSVTDTGTELRSRVGYLPERVGFPPALTGREVLEYHASIRGLEGAGRIPDAIEMVGLEPSAADRAVDGYSNGMRRRLGLAAAVLPNPDVLVLDEPTAGLDPRGVAEFHRIIDRVRTETDATVVLSSHVLTEVERLCDHVALVDQGRVAATGRIDDLVDADTVTVSIHPSDRSAVDDILEAVNTHGTTTATNGVVTVDCPPGEVPALFASLDGRDIAIRDVTVDRGGLEAAFHRTLEEVHA